MTEKRKYTAPSKELIDGVKVKQLRVIPDERGRLGEILRNDDEQFTKFGQVYFTTTYPGVVKAWHFHEKQTDNMVCIKGMLKLALYDDREGSPTRGMINQFFFGEHNPILVQIPAGVYHGWMCISDCEAYVVNIPTETYDYHNPDEFRAEAHGGAIPYDWTRQDG